MHPAFAVTEQFLADTVLTLELIVERTSSQVTLPALCEVVERHLPGSSAAIGVLDTAGETMSMWHTARLDPGLLDVLREFEIPSPEDVVLSVVSVQPPMMILGREPDASVARSSPVIRQLPAPLNAILQREGLTNGWGVPIRDAEEGIMGAVQAFFKEVRWPDPGEVKMLEHIASLARLAIEQGRNHALILEEEDAFRALVQNASDLITVVDAEGTIRYQSPSVERLLGYGWQDLIGVPFFGLLHLKDAARVREGMNNVPQGQASFSEMRFRMRRADQEWMHFEASVSNMLDHPSIRGYVLNARDVTERLHYEQDLLKAKEEAEDVARLKTTMLTNISHEIRTPLAGIIGFSEVLAEEIDGEGQEFAELIGESAQRLTDTLNTVLSLAELEGGEIHLTPTRFDVHRRIEHVLQKFAPRVRRRGLEIRPVVKPDPPLLACLDATAFDNVVTHLVANAIKFTPEGSITVSIEERPKGLEIRVADTGIGISEAFLVHLFDEFKQESEGLDRKYEGSGLGLSITKRLLDVMGGSIEVESEKGQGSVFTVRFPREVLVAAEESGSATNIQGLQAGNG